MKSIVKKMRYITSKKKLESKIQNFIFTGIEWRPLNSVKVALSKFEAANELLENLENNDDVQKVYTNLKLENN